MTAKNADPRLLDGRKDDDGNELDPSKLLDLRILVHHSQVGSVIGKSGDKIKDLREKHRMQIIKIYQEFAPLSTDRVLQLIGEPENVFSCVEDIMETLEVCNFSKYDVIRMLKFPVLMSCCMVVFPSNSQKTVAFEPSVLLYRKRWSDGNFSNMDLSRLLSK